MLDRPWFSMREIQHFVRFGIVDESFLCRIPFQLSVKLHRDMVKDANAVGSVSGFDRGDRFLTRTHTFEEVAHVIAAFVKLDLVVVGI